MSICFQVKLARKTKHANFLPKFNNKLISRQLACLKLLLLPLSSQTECEIRSYLKLETVQSECKI